MFLIKTNGGINSVNYIRFFSVLDFFSLPFQNSRLNFLLLFLSSYGKNSSEPLLSAVVDSGPGHRGSDRNTLQIHGDWSGEKGAPGPNPR